MGSALIIFSGASKQAVVSRLFSLKPIVGLGLISYSVYLWHWPLLTATRLLRQEFPTMPAWVTILAGALSIPAGWLSWKFIETPFRRKASWNRRRIFAFSAGGLAALFGVAAFCQQTAGLMNFRPAEAARILRYRESKNPFEQEAFSEKPDSARPFIFGDRTAQPSFALWGDSHADFLAYPLHEIALKRHLAFRFYGISSMPPLPGAGLRNAGDAAAFAKEYNARVFDILLQDADIHTVILAARWAAYVEGLTGSYGPAEAGGDQAIRILDFPNQSSASSEDVRKNFASLVTNTLTKLQAAGKSVVIVYPVPEIAQNVPQALGREVIRGRDPHAFRVPAKGVFFERQQSILEIFDSLPESARLIRVKPADLLIRDGSIRLMEEDDVLYFDDHHLSVPGARLVMPLFGTVFETAEKLAAGSQVKARVP
jgi:hypothetical protein